VYRQNQTKSEEEEERAGELAKTLVTVGAKEKKKEEGMQGVKDVRSMSDIRCWHLHCRLLHCSDKNRSNRTTREELLRKERAMAHRLAAARMIQILPQI